MAASEFFGRWAKAPVAPDPGLDATTSTAPAVAEAPVVVVEPHLLTSADTLALTTESDFTPFMASGVDESVKRLALKKLFADPHFNIMDRLDIYIDDYNTFVPMSAVMVAALNHGKALLDPLSQLERPLMTLIHSAPVETPDVSAGEIAAAGEVAEVAEAGAIAGPGEATDTATQDPDPIALEPEQPPVTPTAADAPAPAPAPASTVSVPPNAQPPASLQA